MNKIITHPAETLAQVAITFLNLADSILPDDTIIPTEQEIDRIENNAAFFRTLTEHLQDKFSNATRKEYLEFAGEILTDCILQHYALKAAGKVRKTAKMLSNALDKVSKGERVLGAFDLLGKEAAQTIGLAAEYETELVAEGIKENRKILLLVLTRLKFFLQ